MQVEVNEEKSRNVDLMKGESFGFLGFESRLTKRRDGRWRPHLTPKTKARTELLRKLAKLFRSARSQPAENVIALVNPVFLRGWVTYFPAWATVVLLLRPTMGRAQDAPTSHQKLQTRQASVGNGGARRGCINDSGCTMITSSRSIQLDCSTFLTDTSHNPGTKSTGKRSAGNPHAPFDVAGAGNGDMVRLRHRHWRKPSATATPLPNSTAPALDPTTGANLFN